MDRCMKRGWNGKRECEQWKKNCLKKKLKCKISFETKEFTYELLVYCNLGINDKECNKKKKNELK